MTRERRMSELERAEEKNHNAIPICAFAVANIVYGVCLQEVHAHVNELNQMQRSFELPAFLTAADLTSLLVLVRLESHKEIRKHVEGLIITLLCQTVIGFLLNFWYIVSRNDSFVIGYFEPIALIGMLVACAKADFSIKTVACAFLLTICAGFTSGDIWIFSSADRNGIIIFLIIYFISVRNLALKLLHEESLICRLRRPFLIPYTLSVFLVGIVIASLHTIWALPVVFSIVAMFASVAMFYLSAFLMEYNDLLTISVIGLVSQIGVNLVCVPGEHAHNVFVTVIAVLLMVGAILAYFRYAMETEQQGALVTAQMTHHEIYTRMEFCIFTGIVCGLLFYVFKPKLSERDLNNLHYVGLDNIVKKLLNHPVDPVKK